MTKGRSEPACFPRSARNSGSTSFSSKRSSLQPSTDTRIYTPTRASRDRLFHLVSENEDSQLPRCSASIEGTRIAKRIRIQEAWVLDKNKERKTILRSNSYKKRHCHPGVIRSQGPISPHFCPAFGGQNYGLLSTNAEVPVRSIVSYLLTRPAPSCAAVVITRKYPSPITVTGDACHDPRSSAEVF